MYRANRYQKRRRHQSCLIPERKLSGLCSLHNKCSSVSLDGLSPQTLLWPPLSWGWPTEGASYVSYSLIIWLPTSCAFFFFQIPQLDAGRLWSQVSGGPRTGRSFLYSVYHATCLIKTRSKQHHTEKFKDHISECVTSTIQCLQRKLCHNSSHYTMDHNSTVKYNLRERLGVQKLVWRTKDFFWALFSLQRLAGTPSGPVGISTFLPNKEQGFHVRNWAKALDQLTS